MKNSTTSESEQIAARKALLIGEGPYSWRFRGTPKQLIEAGVIQPEHVPPVGKGSITFYRGQRVGPSGFILGRRGEKASIDDGYVQVKRAPAGFLTAVVGKQRPSSQPNFKAFMAKTLAPVQREWPFTKFTLQQWDELDEPTRNFLDGLLMNFATGREASRRIV